MQGGQNPYRLPNASLTCLAAIEGLANLGVHRVILESYSQGLAQALNARDYYLADYGVLMREAVSTCMAMFDAYEFMFHHRSCIFFAHALAQYGYHSATASMSWLDSSLDFVSHLVASESAEHYG